jgi:hypothetical protein
MGPSGFQDTNLTAREDNKAWAEARRQEDRCDKIVGNLEVDNDEFAETVLEAARLGHPDALDWLGRMGVRDQLGL